MCCGPNQRIPYLFSFVLAKCFTQNFIHHLILDKDKKAFLITKKYAVTFKLFNLQLVQLICNVSCKYMKLHEIV
ncbi:hypothetical protein DV713_05030 [Parageobacillus thermoglucosidasius]|nr:hypothetical protein DV713_05030 [Parageobacillus thermoglucosidasius]